MRFYDERKLWYAETESLARDLENKSYCEIMKVFECKDIIRLRSCERPKTTIFGRMLFPLVALAFLVVMPIKWMITGNTYFDSIAKKYGWINRLFEFVGIK